MNDRRELLLEASQRDQNLFKEFFHDVHARINILT